MKDISRIKGSLKQALINVPDEFSFLEVRQCIKTALIKLEKVEQKKIKKENKKIKQKAVKYSPNSLEVIEKMIKEEEQKLKNKVVEKESDQTWFG